MKKNRFILRDEIFGYTLFDKQKLKHSFLSKEHLNKGNEFLNESGFEKWDAKTSGLPSDIIYSPTRVYFELTSECNLRCKLCFNESSKSKADELTAEEVQKTLKGLRKDNVLDVRFCGGELTLRKDWFELISYAKEMGFAVSLNTNGVYEDPTIIDKLSSLDLEQITVSIDGGRDFHDFVTGKGNFDKSVDTLEKLHKKGSHLRINTVLTKGSANDLEEILQLAGRFAEEINFFYMRLTGRALKMHSQVISYEELHQFNKRIEILKSKYKHVNILHGSKVMLSNSINAGMNAELGLKIGGPDGFTRLNILPNGSIWPGGYTPHLKPEFYLGNIKEEGYTLIGIWRNSPRLKEFRRISLELQKRCSACDENGVRCPGASIEMEFYREQNPAHKNPYCIY